MKTTPDSSPKDSSPDRRSFMAFFSSLGLSSTLFPGVLWVKMEAEKTATSSKGESPAPVVITKPTLRDAAAVAGLSFTDDQLEVMLEGVNKLLPAYEYIRMIHLDNGLAPPLYFNPILPGTPIDRTPRPMRRSRR